MGNVTNLLGLVCRLSAFNDCRSVTASPVSGVAQFGLRGSEQSTSLERTICDLTLRHVMRIELQAIRQRVKDLATPRATQRNLNKVMALLVAEQQTKRAATQSNVLRTTVTELFDAVSDAFLQLIVAFVRSVRRVWALASVTYVRSPLPPLQSIQCVQRRRCSSKSKRLSAAALLIANGASFSANCATGVPPRPYTTCATARYRRALLFAPRRTVSPSACARSSHINEQEQTRSNLSWHVKERKEFLETFCN